MATVTRTLKARKPAHGTSRLTLAVNGTACGIRPIPADGCEAYRLRKPDGTRYDVGRTAHGQWLTQPVGPWPCSGKEESNRERLHRKLNEMRPAGFSATCVRYVPIEPNPFDPPSSEQLHESISMITGPRNEVQVPPSCRFPRFFRARHFGTACQRLITNFGKVMTSVMSLAQGRARRADDWLPPRQGGSGHTFCIVMSSGARGHGSPTWASPRAA
jgi:hypothetical protein